MAASARFFRRLLFSKEFTMRCGTYLVTGATGLMGTTALKRLQNIPGVTVKAVCHHRKPHIVAANITYMQADLEKPGDCRRLVDGIDYVLFFAGILMTAPVLAANPVSPLTSNLLMHAQMLEAAYLAGVKKYLVVGSSTGYPAQDTLLHEDDMFRGDPADAYFSVGWMFRYVEALCRMYSTKLRNPMPIAVIRPSTVYGEHEDFSPDKSHMLPALVRKVVDREQPLEVWGDGEVKRDLIYADDLLDACVAALEGSVRLSEFNIAYGREYSLKELLAMILHADGYKNAEIVFNATGPSTGGRRILDTRRAREVLGFRPKTDIESGIRFMLTGYRKYKEARLMEQSR
jgi:GDP-L-fucose synthase